MIKVLLFIEVEHLIDTRIIKDSTNVTCFDSFDQPKVLSFDTHHMC